MDRKNKYLPLLIMALLIGLAGMVVAGGTWQTAGVDTCTLNGVTASNTTIDSSTNTFACYVDNATTCNIVYKGITTSTLVDGANVDCTTPALTTSNNTAVQISCILTGASDSGSVTYLSCTNGSVTTAGENFQFTMDGFSEEQQEDNGETGTIYFSLNDDKRVLIVSISLVLAMLILIIGFVVIKKK